MLDMDADFGEEEVVENPTLKAAYNLAPLHQNQPLRWDHKVDLLGEKIYDKIIHLCEICELPILLYGRMLPCKHVFCFDCARKCEKTCKRCGNRVQKVEKSALGTVFVCTHGAPKHNTKGCRRTYLSQRDLQSHIAHRHLPKTTSESKSSHSAPVPSSHSANLQLPLTQQQAAQQAQQLPPVGSVHSVTSQLQGTGGSHSQQHSPAMPPTAGPIALSPRTSPMVQQTGVPASNPAGAYHPYNAPPVHSGSDQSVYRPLDMAPFSQKQQPQPQHQILPPQQMPPMQQHHMQQHAPPQHSSHGGPQQGGMHQGHSAVQQGHTPIQQGHTPMQQGHAPIQQGHTPMQQGHTPIQQGHAPMQQGHAPMQQGHAPMQQGHAPMQQGHAPMQQGHAPMQQGHAPMQQGLDMSRRPDIPPGHGIPQQAHSLPQGSNVQQGMTTSQDHLQQRHNLPGPPGGVQGDNSFRRNDFPSGMNQQDFQVDRNPPRHDYPPVEQNAPRHDYQLDHNAPRRDFHSDPNPPRRDFQRDNNFGRQRSQDFQGEHNAPRQEFQDETKFTRPDFHDNDMRLGQGSHPPHNPLAQNMMNTSRPPYSQSTQMAPGIMQSNQPAMSPTTHSSHRDLSPIPGNKNMDNFSSSQTAGSGSRTNVNLITVPIQDEGQYRPLPFVNPAQSQGGNTSFTQTHPTMQNPQQSFPQQSSNQPAGAGMYSSSRNNNQGGPGGGGSSAQNDMHPSGNTGQNINFNQGGNSQGQMMNPARSNIAPNMMPAGMMQGGNFNNRPQGGALLANPRNQGPSNNSRGGGQTGSPRFNSGNRWTGPRGMQPRMPPNHQRPRGDTPRGNYYNN